MSFEGFGPTTTFLKDLGRNNSKEWFHDHYDDYQEHLLEPAMAFVEAIGPLLRRFAPDTQAVHDGGSGTDLARVVTKLERAGYDVGGERYKRVPSGYPPDHPRAALLRRDGVYAGRDLPLPPEAATAKFPSFCAAQFRKVTPLVDWLADVFG